jgi:hypothetical protein
LQDMGRKKLVKAGKASRAFIIPGFVLKLWGVTGDDIEVAWAFDAGKVTLTPVKAGAVEDEDADIFGDGEGGK